MFLLIALRFYWLCFSPSSSSVLYMSIPCASSLSCIQLFATPWTVAHLAPLSMGILRARILEDCHALLQRIFPIQGSNPGLLHCRQILYHLSHQGSPSIPSEGEWFFFISPIAPGKYLICRRYFTSLCSIEHSKHTCFSHLVMSKLPLVLDNCLLAVYLPATNQDSDLPS